MIFKKTLDLSAGIAEAAAVRIPVNATGIKFLVVPSDVYVRFDDVPDRIPFSAPQEVQFGVRKVKEMFIDTDGQAGAGELVVLVFTQGEFFAE